MDQREVALTDRLVSEGVSVVEWDIEPWGLYLRSERLIVLQAGMTQGQRLATLTHEALHAWRDDDGHQTPAVESLINRQVAMRLISMPAYAAAERLHPGSVAGIAHELDLPVWVVEAFQEFLSRAA